MELLRFTTAGSVDDGKSTLIGRLLYDSKQIFDDQLEAVERTSNEHGFDYLNLALLTDGLRAEREQGITIDVAYRYFATPQRTFIIADTPGHIQYTRNMVTGASTAELAVVLVDARSGVQEQTRRHAIIASLLRIPQLVLCVNKMDLVDYSREAFDRISGDFRGFASQLQVADVTAIPISALHGDNVVDRSEHMPWYEGMPLLEHLEQVKRVEVGADGDLTAGRFPVQSVIRPMSEDYPDYRGYAGTVAAGVFRPGDEVVVLPSGITTRIRSIDSYDGALTEAVPTMAVTITLEDDLDVSRGHMICASDDRPTASDEFEATICWMTDRSELVPGRRFWLKHTTRRVRAVVSEVLSRLDVNTLARDAGAQSLSLNEIGRVRLRTSEPLFHDAYRRSRATGSLILIDEATFNTVGAGMIVAAGA